MNKKFFLLILLSIALVSFKPVETAVWKLDAVHSNLGFSILHLGVSDIRGTVLLNNATIKTDNEDFTDGIIELEADMNSIDTDNDKRDAHLKTADFFDTAKFPLLSFKSTSLKKEGLNYSILGNLTMHGVTKPVKLNATIKSGISPVNNKPIAGIKVTGTIKRSDFDISKTTPVEILSDDVNIEANLEFQK